MEAWYKRKYPARAGYYYTSEGSWMHPDYPFIVATPDLVLIDRKTEEVSEVIEFKSAKGDYIYSKAAQYQVQAMLLIFGVEQIQFVSKNLDTKEHTETSKFVDKELKDAILGELKGFYKSKLLSRLIFGHKTDLTTEQANSILI